MKYLTPTGRPKLGATCEIEMNDNSWLMVKVRGRAETTTGDTVVILECLDDEGGVTEWMRWDHLLHRSVQS